MARHISKFRSTDEEGRRYLEYFIKFSVFGWACSFVFRKCTLGERPKEIRGWTRIVVETDEENPTPIATITEDNIEMADGYRVRERPDYDC
mgnify:FL=1